MPATETASQLKFDPDALRRGILADIAAAPDITELEAIRVRSLGKKGSISLAMKSLAALDPATRRDLGQTLNTLKHTITEALADKRTTLEAAALTTKLTSEAVDVSLPPRPNPIGTIHPLSQTFEEAIAIFADMGFAVAEGPDIETDYYNFTALNIPPWHPSRQEHDTFYLTATDAKEGGEGARKVLRTHTSPVQIRVMETTTPPIRIIAPGRTYRADHDATHSPMFHQCEGLAIGTDITMAHLKGCLIEFCRQFFGVRDLPVRFRPSYFPFTEPSAEVDIGCSRQGGGLSIGAGDDWLEILGCGMVHPQVLTYCGIDPSKYQGFAFGVGLERIAMLKYGIADLRPFFDSDLRWLRHYGFTPFAPHLGFGL